MQSPLQRWLGLGVLAIIAVLAFGMLAVYVDHSRGLAAKVTCQNNLRALALLGTPYNRGDTGLVLTSKDAKHAASVWPGTVMNDKLKPDERLSWVAFALPTLLEPGLNTPALAKSLDTAKAWNAGPNRDASLKVLRTLQCPANPMLPAAGEPAVTMYVGIAGLGADAATLPLSEPISKRAGAFRYDSATPLAVISAHDGISQTLLFGQTTHRNGLWLQGGPGTVRGLDDTVTALPLIGPGGQFGGTLPGGTWFAFADGSVRFFRTATAPTILYSLATIAGGPAEFRPEE